MAVIAFLIALMIYGIIIPAKILIVILGATLEVIGGAVVAIISSLIALTRAFKRK